MVTSGPFHALLTTHIPHAQTRDKDGLTALHLASIHNRPPAARALLAAVPSCGGDKDRKGRTAAELALRRGYSELAAALKAERKVGYGLALCRRVCVLHTQAEGPPFCSCCLLTRKYGFFHSCVCSCMQGVRSGTPSGPLSFTRFSIDLHTPGILPLILHTSARCLLPAAASHVQGGEGRGALWAKAIAAAPTASSQLPQQPPSRGQPAAVVASASTQAVPAPAPVLVIAPEECWLHRTAPEPLVRGGLEAPPPENVGRLRVLMTPGGALDISTGYV